MCTELPYFKDGNLVNVIIIAFIFRDEIRYSRAGIEMLASQEYKRERERERWVRIACSADVYLFIPLNLAG